MDPRIKHPSEMPSVIPVFPLAGALLLPRSEIPLNVFEPRYLAMVNDALRGHRLIGIIQPEDDQHGKPRLHDVGCAGRITAFAEQPNGHLLITLSGVARFSIRKEVDLGHQYRSVEADFSRFENDFTEGFGEEFVNRDNLLSTLRIWLDENGLRADWDEVAKSSNEMLVNSLSMLAPYDAASKQALLEAPDLKTRAEVLIALTEMSIMRASSSSSTLQ